MLRSLWLFENNTPSVASSGARSIANTIVSGTCAKLSAVILLVVSKCCPGGSGSAVVYSSGPERLHGAVHHQDVLFTRLRSSAGPIRQFRMPRMLALERVSAV